MKAKVRIHRYLNGELAIFHGPRKLAEYDQKGKEKKQVVEDKVSVAA